MYRKNAIGRVRGQRSRNSGQLLRTDPTRSLRSGRPPTNTGYGGGPGTQQVKQHSKQIKADAIPQHTYNVISTSEQVGNTPTHADFGSAPLSNPNLLRQSGAAIAGVLPAL